MKAFFARLHGRVQGVGFRWYAVNEAKRLRLSGWVRNTGAGDVEVWAEGGEKELAVFEQWLRQGPPGARVDDMEKVDGAPKGIFRNFGVDY
ncbi:MAG: acylphosphatase [Treponema sp.]|nr:acylphosphatase [Treponema sp.]